MRLFHFLSQSFLTFKMNSQKNRIRKSNACQQKNKKNSALFYKDISFIFYFFLTMIKSDKKKKTNQKIHHQEQLKVNFIFVCNIPPLLSSVLALQIYFKWSMLHICADKNKKTETRIYTNQEHNSSQ